MKQFIFLLTLLISVCATAQVKSGLIVGASHSIKTSDMAGLLDNGSDPHKMYDYQWKSKFGISIGYQFRFELSKRFFLDASVLGKMQQEEVKADFMLDESGFRQIDLNSKKWLFAPAVNGTVNYRIWKGLSVGLGIEPTLFFNTDKVKYNQVQKQVFDCPVLIKAGYGFKNIEFAISYKHGFKSLYNNSMFSSSTKNKELQVSVFVPIFK